MHKIFTFAPAERRELAKLKTLFSIRKNMTLLLIFGCETKKLYQILRQKLAAISTENFTDINNLLPKPLSSLAYRQRQKTVKVSTETFILTLSSSDKNWNTITRALLFFRDMIYTEKLRLIILIDKSGFSKIQTYAPDFCSCANFMFLFHGNSKPI